jgi:tryptophan halogenase
MKKIEKIVIVGGGSAGWMSAATLINAFPNKEIVLIESPDFQTVGVGESTLGGIKEWTNLLGINEKDFMKECNAVYKMSIKFTDFYKKDYGSFHYPFGQPYLQGTFNGLNDWYVKKVMEPELDVNDYARTFFPALTIAESNKIHFNQSGTLNNFSFNRDVAYHFDATKFALWLKNNYCIPKGVSLIQDTVKDVSVSSLGVDKIILSSGEEITADLFIDCTGWKSLLLGQSLQEPFDDFSDVLPNNKAWATRIPYTDIENEMEPFTNCTAIGNGWVWNIPVWDRIGTGYVYSDKYITPEGALNEFKDYLRSRKMKHFDSERDVDLFEYKDITFRVGIHKRTWVKNVVAIGLSAGFIEPLESNGLFTIHEFLTKLTKSLRRESYTQWDRDAYNMATRNQYMAFKEFVEMHYALSNRDDTRYWRDVTEREYQPKVASLTPYTYSGFQDLASKKLSQNRYDSTGGLHCIAAGMNYFPVDIDVIKTWKHYDLVDYESLCQPTFKRWEENKKNWKYEAEISPTMYRYLKENIHDVKD